MNIDQLVDNSSRYQLLSFMDVYSGYNQIPLFRTDTVKAAFMIEHANYQYNVIHFEFKNTEETYHKMMSKIFWEEIGETLEIYMDNIIVKSIVDTVHA